MDDKRLHRLLGGPDLTDLRRRLRARFERGEQGTVFTLGSLTATERRALEGLTGRPVKIASSMRLTLPELDAALSRAGLASHLRQALELLDGPILDLRQERQAREQAWERLRASDEPRLRSFLATAGAITLLKRLCSDPDGARELLARAQGVLARLPARGIPLAQLAAQTQGNAHALDQGEPLATLVLRASITDPAEEPESDTPEGPREQWARLGVTVNELSAPVLCLNLPQADGEPLHLTLRRLLRAPPAWEAAGRDIFICENPGVVTVAADRLGARSSPLVCTDGMPRTAQRTLLSQLAQAGARLHYHGDFDWPGLIIANLVLRTLAAHPWRMSAPDYTEAAQAGGSPLAGARVEASWDAELAERMHAEGLAVHEEAVVERLLEDLNGT